LGSTIMGTGIYLPPKVVKNSDFEKLIETSDEWITTRTGIKERRFVEDNVATTDLAIEASKMALQNAKVDAADLDMVILATYTPDRVFSAGGCVVADKIGAKKAAAFDIEVACSGFIYGAMIADQFIRTGAYKRVLVIGADVNSKFLDFTDRGTCILFGDGAAAAVFGPAIEGYGVLEFVLGADGSGSEQLYLPAGGSKMPASHETVDKRQHYLVMNGKEVFKFASAIVDVQIKQVLAKAGLTLDQIKLIVPHQANIRIIESAAKKLGIPVDRFYMNLDRYGNTVAATIPLALHEAVGEGKVVEGDYVLLVGFGGGLTWGTILIRWNPKTR
jgi:3-oxoacyl-[acyl-carrier-protein] synthase III